MGNAAQGQGGDPRPGPAVPRGDAAREVQLAATEIGRFGGVAAYHTSVILGGQEFYFDGQGIESGPALVSHLAGRPQGLRMEVRKLGHATRSGAAMLEVLAPFFAKGSYDLLRKNCNAFTDVALWFLLGARLDGHYSRAERILAAAEPLSTHLLNQVLRAAEEIAAERGGGAGPSSLQGGYVLNPLSEGFSADCVIAALRRGGCGPGGASSPSSLTRCCTFGNCLTAEELVFNEQGTSDARVPVGPC